MIDAHNLLRRPAQPPPGASLSRQQRLFRWAELLEREPARHFETLPSINCLPVTERVLPSPSGSPIEAAYRDPVLRIEGLCSSSAAAALVFFQLSHAEFDRILGRRRRPHEQTGRYIAWRIRNVADPSEENRLFFLGVLVSLFLATILLVVSAVHAGWHR